MLNLLAGCLYLDRPGLDASPSLRVFLGDSARIGTARNGDFSWVCVDAGLFGKLFFSASIKSITGARETCWTKQEVSDHGLLLRS
jgi:hypothetical protein